MNVVLRISLRQLAGTKRLLLLVLLAALPVGLALILTFALDADQTSNADFNDTLIDALLVSVVMPLLSLVIATAAFGNELEDRTLSYLVLKPVPRYQIVLAKLIAGIAIGAPLLVISGVLSTVIGTGELGTPLAELDSVWRASAAVGIALLLGYATYTAMFTWAGLVTTRALPYGLVYIILWEGIISSFLGGIHYLSVRGYTLGLVHGLDKVSFGELESRVIELPAALIGVVVVSVGFYLLTTRRLREMDVP